MLEWSWFSWNFPNSSAEQSEFWESPDPRCNGIADWEEVDERKIVSLTRQNIKFCKE